MVGQLNVSTSMKPHAWRKRKLDDVYSVGVNT